MKKTGYPAKYAATFLQCQSQRKGERLCSTAPAQDFLILLSSVVNPDPHGSGTFAWIQQVTVFTIGQ